MRNGFSTGSCAAAAALASCLWQLTGECPERVEITTPAGVVYTPQIIPRSGFLCGVIKDAGDDPDLTDGHEVRARVDIGNKDGDIQFVAGEGVGTVTLKGLKVPPGEPAVNPVPRKMIADAVRGVIGQKSARVTIEIEGGRELARRTFNPRLGIVNGLSVLGTSGLVRPMSEEALKDTIALEMSIRRAAGHTAVALVFGHQGEQAFIKNFSSPPTVQISNFVGFALDEAVRQGFLSVVLSGHPGKMCKVAGGVMQTHSQYGDCRLEPLCVQLALMGAPKAVLESVLACPTTDAAAAVAKENGYMAVWDRMAAAALQYCKKRVRGECAVSVYFMDGEGRVLGAAKEE